MTDAKKPSEEKTPKPAVKSKPQPKPLRSGQSIVPRETVAGTALIFVIGIMTFLACLTLGAVSMVNTSAAKCRTISPEK